MSVEILRRGSRGNYVKRWQTFLVGQDIALGAVDGDFGPATEQATDIFQNTQLLSSDGVVGPQTLAKPYS